MRKQLIICDDNRDDLKEIRAVVEDFIQRNQLDYEISEFVSGRKLLQMCKEEKLKPEIIFMDIELNQETGIEVVKMINEIMPDTQVVYVSNYLQYATDVYTTEHRYYVLKPELSKRIQEVFDKILKLSELYIEDVVIHLKQNVEIVLHKRDIILLEREGRGTKVEVRVDGVEKLYHSNMALDKIAERIGSAYITKCHNSFYVGLYFISLYRRDSIVLETGEVISISRKYQQVVRKEFTNWTKEHLF